MLFLNKLEKLKKLSDRDEDVRMLISFTQNGIDDQALTSIKNVYPFLPQSYFKFLNFTDGMSVFGISFCGSGNNVFSSYDYLISLSKSYVDISEHFPFAKDASGDIFYINFKQIIEWYDVDNEVNNSLMTSFENFMDEILMGPKYEKLNPFGIHEDDEWFLLLNKMGWI